MHKANIELETLTCPSCLQKINNAIQALPGVEKESVKVLFNASKVKLNFDGTLIALDAITNAISNLGFKVKKAQAKAL